MRGVREKLGVVWWMVVLGLIATTVIGAESDITVAHEVPPPNYKLAWVYGREMTLTYLIGVFAYLVKVYQSRVDTMTWFKGNVFRLLISLVLMWLISFGLVVVPNLAQLFGSLGFNADQGTVGIAAMVLGFIIKSTDSLNPQRQ
jgi:hypothetical protein